MPLENLTEALLFIVFVGTIPALLWAVQQDWWAQRKPRWAAVAGYLALLILARQVYVGVRAQSNELWIANCMLDGGSQHSCALEKQKLDEELARAMAEDRSPY